MEAFSNYLLERNTGGIVIEDSIRNGQTVLTAYVHPEKNKAFTRQEIEQFFESIKANFDNPQYEIVALEYIETEDWLAGWKKTFVPIHVTEKIVVRPTWETYNIQPGEIEIVVDPRMAFGTGHHETTAQCMQGLEMLNVKGKQVLDYGCGTGILAIAAYKMGADKVIACDIDPEAIECAAENIKLNNAKIELVESGKYAASLPCDIIAANLSIDQIIEVFAELDKSLKAGGHIVFSGIPADDKQRFLDFIIDKPFVINNVLIGDEWVSYIASKEITDGD
jgi:ribosomal protein L11 methyltransferase